MDARAVIAGDGPAGHRPNEARAARCGRAAGVGGGLLPLPRFLRGLLGGSASGLFFRGSASGIFFRGPSSGLFLCLPAGLFLSLSSGLFLGGHRIAVFHFLLGNLLGEGLLLGFVFFRGGLQRLPVGPELRENLVRLRALGLQLRLVLCQLILRFLQRDLFRGKLLSGGLDLLRHGFHPLEHPRVRQGDLVDHIDAVEHIRKTAGLEQDRPIGELSVLLHGADPGAVLLIEPVTLGERLVQLVLLFGDQEVVLLDLQVRILDGVLRELDFLVDHAFLHHQIVQLRVVAVELAFNAALLGLNTLALLFQLIDPLLDFAGALGVNGQNDDACDHGEHQKGRDRADNVTAVFVHKKPPDYTSRNFRMDMTLPKMPTKSPAAPKVAIIGSSSFEKGTISNSFSASTFWICFAIRL